MKKRMIWLLFFLLVPASNLRLVAQRSTPPVLDEEILKRIQHEVSGSIAFEHIAFLSTLHREFGFKGHHLAAQYVIDKAAQYGLKAAVIERYLQKEEDKSAWKYIAPHEPFWNCRQGDLRLVKPYPMLISDFESTAGTIAPGSHSTDVTAEIVFVGRGDSEEAYKGKDVKGKIVLSENGMHYLVHKIAVHQFGALGTINYDNFHGEAPQESEAIGGIVIWPLGDWAKEPTFGFNLSETKGLFLKGLLEKGEKVVVSGRIEAEVIKDGVFELPTAVIPGSIYPDEEFIFFAHLDHPKPGAHDNASGCAVLLEIARTLSRLIEKNIIPAPARTIRFMWVPHMCGLEMYFFHHPEKISKIKGGCNVDCVGVNQAKFPADFHVALPLPSLYTYMIDITNNLVTYFNEKITTAVHYGPDEDLLFSPEGSRNLFCVHRTCYQVASDEENANSLNIPAINFYDLPLPPRHSQLNFLDYIDRTSLGRVSYLGAIISYAFAAAGDGMGPRLINEIDYQGKIRLEREFDMAKRTIEESDKANIHQDFTKSESLLYWGMRREKRVARSLEELLGQKSYLKLLLAEHQRLLDESLSSYSKSLKKYYELKCQSLNINPQKEQTSLSRSQWQKTIPVLTPTTKSLPRFSENYGLFIDRLGEKFIEKYKSLSLQKLFDDKSTHEVFNYIDGQNTIAEIYEAIQAERWSEGHFALDSLTFEEMLDYVRLLKDAQIIGFKNK
ncbi:MAG: DUF4910 domain-containing protein [Candidatus Aminicenantales bacterium]|jgi:hypothetical protein